MNNKEALENISKSLFTASEALREALDTIDLENLDLGLYQPFIEATHGILEKMAQDIQQKARS